MTTPEKSRPRKPASARPATAPDGDRWIPIGDGALQVVQQVRADVQKKIRMRPDLSLVVAAMLEHAAASPDLVDAVARHGLAAYAKALKPSAVTPDPAPAATP